MISGAFALVNILADSVGPGTVGLRGDSPHFFLVSAFLTSAFVLLNVFWAIIYFKAIDIQNRRMIAYVFLSHLIASLMVRVAEIYCHHSFNNLNKSKSFSLC